MGKKGWVCQVLMTGTGKTKKTIYTPKLLLMCGEGKGRGGRMLFRGKRLPFHWTGDDKGRQSLAHPDRRPLEGGWFT